jgi:hypothetical protein
MEVELAPLEEKKASFKARLVALADGTYLEYLRGMYGGKIYTPTGEDSQRCFQEYLADAQRRLQRTGRQPESVAIQAEQADHVFIDKS